MVISGVTSPVQAGQRLAFLLISVKQSGHSRVLASSALISFSNSLLVGRTTKKYRIAAVSRKEIRASMKAP